MDQYISQENRFILVRGDANLDLTVYASKRPLHSGHYAGLQTRQ
jgi:hypothetical protein